MLHKAKGFGAALVVLLSTLGLGACDRDTYTSWNCTNPQGEKIAMVLKKAKMQFQNQQLDYCGSLGPLSYFDSQCPAQIQDSSKIFDATNGQLLSNGIRLTCDAL
ncbi:hypothetical protein [Polynucleobacter brandtiae]|uniref:Lipoprotein n=1 Tax=Polynucleobacter brandtiae TaxID=1938816 RepID=A0A2M8VYN7_9BURK|nr:hypothetical protein [Polynucleobacter brandtiae]PJI82962.1 hypothetical protein B0G85_0352 [Polynucleobacter brandtiae]